MGDAGLDLFNSLSAWRHLNALIDGGETEGLHLECKSPVRPSLNQDMKGKLARALSGFSNTAGGVVLWGVATTPHSHSKLDVISYLEPVGNCAAFEKQVRAVIPTLTTPSVLHYDTKLIKRRKTDKHGVIAAYIPLALGEPVLNAMDNVFYFRSPKAFVPAPYELIKRLFAATDVPDVYPQFSKELVTLEADGSWLIVNRSAAFAEDVDVSVIIENPATCDTITPVGFEDASDLNPGERTFVISFDRGIHRGMPIIAGRFRIRMKTSKRMKRRLDMSIFVYANRMQARRVQYTLTLAKAQFTVKTIREQYI